MSSVKHKFEILIESIISILNKTKKDCIHRKNEKQFAVFGKSSLVEKPLYVRKLKYVSIGNNTQIKAGSRIQCDDNYRGQMLKPCLQIGDRCGIGYHFTAFVYDNIEIGNDVSIADNVMLTSENHGINPEGNVPFGLQPLTTAPIRIGDWVWLAKNVCVMPGVTIGERTVIGANSVVTHDIPPYSIAVGAPAKVIKKWNKERHEWERIC